MSAIRNHGFVDDSEEIQSYRGDHAFLPESTALYLDLYHLDAAYMAWKGRHTGTATFDLYVRSNPFAGGFMLVAGLEPAMDYLQRFVYTDSQLAYLEQIRHYEPAFLAFLSEMRFSGDVFGIREGEIAFPNEPLLRVTAHSRIRIVAGDRRLDPDRDQGRTPTPCRPRRQRCRFLVSARARALFRRARGVYRWLRQYLVRRRRYGI
jgi:hypothetical protein